MGNLNLKKLIDLTLLRTYTNIVKGLIGTRASQSDLTTHTSDSTVHVTSAEKQTWNGKQDSLTFDEEPTEGSSNPVKSSGIKAAIEGIPQATTEKAGLMSSEDKEKIDEMGYATEQEVKDLFDGDVFPPEDVATDEDIEHLFD